MVALATAALSDVSVNSVEKNHGGAEYRDPLVFSTVASPPKTPKQKPWASARVILKQQAAALLGSQVVSVGCEITKRIYQIEPPFNITRKNNFPSNGRGRGRGRGRDFKSGDGVRGEVVGDGSGTGRRCLISAPRVGPQQMCTDCIKTKSQHVGWVNEKKKIPRGVEALDTVVATTNQPEEDRSGRPGLCELAPQLDRSSVEKCVAEDYVVDARGSPGLVSVKNSGVFVEYPCNEAGFGEFVGCCLNCECLLTPVSSITEASQIFSESDVRRSSRNLSNSVSRMRSHVRVPTTSVLSNNSEDVNCVYDPAKFLDDGFTFPPSGAAGGAGIMIFVDVREYDRFKVYLDELNKSGRVSEEVLALFCVKPTREDLKVLCASVQTDAVYKNLEMIHKLKPNNLLRDLTAQWRIEHDFAQQYLLVVGLETVNDKFRRQYPFPNLTLHAGKIEKGESVFFAATRELFEETRIRVSSVRERIGLMSQGMIMYSAYVTPETSLVVKDDVLYIG